MQRLFATIMLVLVVIGALGFYLGWFTVAGRDSGSDANVTLSVDKEKIEEDRVTAVEEIQDMGRKLKD